MTFANELKTWRARMGYTQREAAAHLAVSERTYEGWEYGRYEPDHIHFVQKAMEMSKRKARA